MMLKKTFWISLLISGLVFCCLSLNAHAGGVVTDCSKFGTMSEEGTLAWALYGGGIVTFECSGTIFVTPEIRIEDDTHIDGNGQNIVLSGNNLNSVFIVWPGKKLYLFGLTIMEGAGFGGLRNWGGTVTLDNCIISGNTSGFGAGIINENYSDFTGTMILISTTVSDNNANQTIAHGGGIQNQGNMTLTDSTVTRNSATTSAGGIHNSSSGSLTLINSTVSDNTARDCGGIFNNGGVLTLLNSTVSGNRATDGDGGGISYFGEATGSVTLKNSTLSGNTATERGGGIDSYGGTIIIENSTVSNNHSDWIGGGIITFVGATLEITNSTISGNSCTDRGCGLESFGGPVTITNSTLSGNSSYQGGGIYNYAPLTLNHVTFSGNSAVQGDNLYVVNSIEAATQMSNTLIANGLTSSNCAGNPLLITDNGYNLDDDNTCNLINPTSIV